MRKGDKIINKRAPGYQKERSERQQARILEQLAIAPASMFEIAEVLHLSLACVHRHLSALQEKPNRRVRVSDYELAAKGRPRRIYGLGGGRDITVAKVQRNRILAAIEEPSSALDLLDELTMLPGALYRYINQMLAKQKIHVVRWEWSGRTSYAIYAAGKGESAPRPTEMPAPIASRRRPQGIFAALGI